MADASSWAFVLIEGVLVFGGALAFGWWQLRSVARDQADAARRRAEQAPCPDAPAPEPPPAPPQPPPAPR